MDARVCTVPNIAFVVGVMRIYKINPSIDHWKVAKNVLRYLQGTQYFMIIYRITNNLKVINCSNSYFSSYINIKRNQHLAIFYDS